MGIVEAEVVCFRETCSDSEGTGEDPRLESDKWAELALMQITTTSSLHLHHHNMLCQEAIDTSSPQ